MMMAQERTASPFICTVQAPQSETPQPNFVPVKPSSSRKNHMSGIDGSPSNARSCPFTRTFTICSSQSGKLSSHGLPLTSSVTSPISAAGRHHRHMRSLSAGVCDA
jgi:hypothetical protein